MLPHPKRLRSVYLDQAAATPVGAEVARAMAPWFVEQFGNPSALYKLGIQARAALEASRRTVAQILQTQPDTIIFTGGGTEANNLAVFGVARAYERQLTAALATATPLKPPPSLRSELALNTVKGQALSKGGELNPLLRRGGGRGRSRQLAHLISTPIEHHSVLFPLRELARQGCEVTYLKVDRHGLINPLDVIRAFRPETILISIMYANNEIGTIEPIAEIGRLLLKYRKQHNTPYPYFHTDACQAAGYLDLSVEKLHVDLMTINASKIYGPKGVGAIYVRRGVKLQPLMFGGGQERGLRPGTENVPGIVGLAKALELVQYPPLFEGGRGGGGREKEINRLRALTGLFYQKLITSKLITNKSLNGPAIGEWRLPNNLNVTFSGLDGETLLLYLDAAGIACSTASACEAEAGGTSHVLKAIGRSAAEAKSSLRFTLGKGTTKSDIEYTVRQIAEVTQKFIPSSYLRQVIKAARQERAKGNNYIFNSIGAALKFLNSERLR